MRIPSPWQPFRDEPRLADFASASPAMRPLLETARRVVPSDASLLFLGETGVGKERLARAIHAESPRRKKPFVALSCVAVPETLLEAELFGFESGSFTGAARTRRGWFELAHGGAIFLDEIGEMPPHLQAKLLQVLQERKVRRIGSERLLPVDVRVMAATNRDLKADLRTGRFRKDLYYRVGVVTLQLPPLRDRREDIPALAERFLARFGREPGRQAASLSIEALAALRRYDWPGNVRELINIVERTVLLSSARRISLADLPRAVREAFSGRPSAAAAPPVDGVGAPSFPAEWKGLSLRELRRRAAESAERAYLEHLLAEACGRVGQAAARAGVTPRALYNRMRRHGLSKEAFRRAASAARGA